MLERLNILELFGADKNKYHSCIITCYSFDFLFFEQRVLPSLRRAGMININVFVDEKMYQQQLANLDGNYTSKQSYSITPIKLNGAFHPKILMGFGKNNGFLAIGSGNLTHSGLSSNDEVWAAFHTYKSESKALPIFNSTFEYLKNLKPFSYGYNAKKWDWLLKDSQWLTELQKSDGVNAVSNLDEEILLLKSFADGSIYEQLIDSLPKSKLKNITIISPYFNKQGDLIMNFIEDLKPDSVDVIVDNNFGTIPYQFIQDKRVRFHNWEVVKANTSNSGARLHAKMFQFQYEDCTCILTGSANATIEAFGSKSSNSRNAEASILIKSKKNKNWLEEMQINLPLENSFDLASYNFEKAISNIVDFNSFGIRINHTELDITELSIYVSPKDNIPEEGYIVIDKRNDEKSYYPIPINSSEPIIIELSEVDAELGFRVYIANSSQKRISYYGKIHNQQLIQRTNPDAKSSKFLEILNGTELGNSDLITLLEFANFKESPNVRIPNSSNNAVKDKNKNEDLKEYKKVSEEQFHQNEKIIEQRYNSSASQLTMLEDFLNNMTFKDVEEDFNDSSERTAEGSKDSGVKGNNFVVEDKTVLTFHEGQRVKRKIQKTFKNIYDVIEQKHNNVLDILINMSPTDIKFSIKNIQALLVGTHLIFMKQDEKYSEERFKFIVRYTSIQDLHVFEKIKKIKLKRLDEHKGLKTNEVAYSADGNVLGEFENLISKYKGIKLIYCDETSSINIEHNFFLDNPIYSKHTADLYSLKGFLINTVSKSLLLMANGVEDYSSKELARFNAFKKRLFYRILVLFSNLRWTNKELELAELFLLNVFYTLLPADISVDEVLKEYSDLTAKTPLESSESDTIIKRVLMSFSNWMQTYQTNKTDLINVIDRSTIGRIIFKSKFGFAIVTSNFKGTLNLNTPLGIFNKDSQKYEIRKVKGGLKAIMYNG